MRITKQTIINARADDVWKVVAHEFDRIGLWATAVPSSHEATAATAPVVCPVGGRTCQTTMAMFPEVEERIVAYDEVARTLSYEPVRGMPGFVASAHSSWRVVSVDARRSQVSFTANVTTRGLPGVLLGLAMRMQLRREGDRGLDDLRHYIEHRRPSPRKQRQLDRASVTRRRPLHDVGRHL
jgi:hypothetical protein